MANIVEYGTFVTMDLKDVGTGGLENKAEKRRI